MKGIFIFHLQQRHSAQHTVSKYKTFYIIINNRNRKMETLKCSVIHVTVVAT